MISNDEKRRIANSLRESWKPTWHGEKMLHRLTDAIGFDRSVSSYGKYRYYREFACRLADLIEPTDTAECIAEVKVDGEELRGYVMQAARELRCIDREALLKLADDCDRACYIPAERLKKIAERIRYALGMVTDND